VCLLAEGATPEEVYAARVAPARADAPADAPETVPGRIGGAACTAAR